MKLRQIDFRWYSASTLVLFSALFGLIGMLSRHIQTVSPQEAAAGEVILGTMEEVTFSPFTVVDVWWFFLFTVIGAAAIVVLSRMALIFAGRGKGASFRVTVRMALLFAAVMLVCWLPYMLTWFPGGVYSDTLNVIDQAYGMVPLSNQHTLLYTFEWKVCLKLAGYNLFIGCALMMAFQAVVMAAVCSYTVLWLNRHGVGRVGCAFSVCFFALFPLFPYYVVSLWKDTTFSTFVLWFCLCFADAVLARGRISRVQLASLCVSALLVAFARNNGKYIVLAAAVFLLVVCRREIREALVSLFVPLFATLLVIIVVQGPVYSRLGVDSSSTVESLGVPIQQVARVIAYDGELSPEAEDVFYSIMPRETWKAAYRPLLVDSVKWNPSFNAAALSENKLGFVSAYLDTGLRNPQLYLEGFLMSSAGFWNPLVGTNENVAYVQLDMWNTSPISQIDIIESLTGVSLRSVLQPHGYFSCALFALIMLASLAVLAVNRQWQWACALVPMLLLWGTLIIASPIAYSLRYCYALVLAIPLFVAFPVLALRWSTVEGPLCLTRDGESETVMVDVDSSDQALSHKEEARSQEMEIRESLMRGYGDVLDGKTIEATTVFDRIRAHLRRAPRP